VTSHDVVALARRRFRTRTVGHTGTLDPFATGLLVLVLGRATRLARFIAAGRKEYLADARLGWATTTDDASGDPLGAPASGPWPSAAAVERALADLVGRYPQRPPAYSAKRLRGERSHERARAGLAVELAPTPVEVDALELLEYRPPVLRFRALAGPGTYVRAIARDLGAALGVGSHLTALRRQRVGRFGVGDAVPAERLSGGEPLLDPLELVGELPRVALGPADAARARHGGAVGAGAPEGECAALVADGALIAVAEGRNGRWQPAVVLATE
jgi:tRNA pseudouridine55 synthase